MAVDIGMVEGPRPVHRLGDISPQGVPKYIPVCNRKANDDFGSPTVGTPQFHEWSSNNPVSGFVVLESLGALRHSLFFLAAVDDEEDDGGVVAYFKMMQKFSSSASASLASASTAN